MWLSRVLDRWFGENLKYVSFKTTAFVLNHKGFPVLPAQAELYLKVCLRNHVDVAVSEQESTDTSTRLAHFKYYGFVVKRVVEGVRRV